MKAHESTACRSMAPFVARAAMCLLTIFAHQISLAGYVTAENILAVTSGVYRLPSLAGTQVMGSRDHVTHNPHNRLDMRVGAGTQIVAAAEGVIRYIQDSFATTCPRSTWTGSCSSYTGPAGASNCYIRGTPGFSANNGSYFAASTANCDSRRFSKYYDHLPEISL